MINPLITAWPSACPLLNILENFLKLLSLLLPVRHSPLLILGPSLTDRLVPVQVLLPTLLRTVLGGETDVAPVGVGTGCETQIAELGCLEELLELCVLLDSPFRKCPQLFY